MPDLLTHLWQSAKDLPLEQWVVVPVGFLVAVMLATMIAGWFGAPRALARAGYVRAESIDQDITGALELLAPFVARLEIVDQEIASKVHSAYVLTRSAGPRCVARATRRWREEPRPGDRPEGGSWTPIFASGLLTFVVERRQLRIPGALYIYPRRHAKLRFLPSMGLAEVWLDPELAKSFAACSDVTAAGVPPAVRQLLLRQAHSGLLQSFTLKLCPEGWGLHLQDSVWSKRAIVALASFLDELSDAVPAPRADE